MAPKFYGEFQKAIDYVGDLDRFKKEYIVHEAIAQHFGYRLSIHSGSDKFGVYPTIGSVSKRGWHVKTAGTNWLEALRVVAKNDPEFMVELYAFAMDNLNAAKAYYAIDATTSNAMQVKDIDASNVASTLDDDMSRQVLHVTFGIILTHTVEGVKIYKDRIYSILKHNYEDYTFFLKQHIGKHVALLDK
jgi:tagaturonate epimerase